MDTEKLTKDPIDGELVDVDDKIQVVLYERFCSGAISREQFKILMQKLELWQALSRELTQALSTEGAERTGGGSAELEHLALLADHASRMWAQYGKEIRDGWRQIAESGNLLSAMIGAAPEAQEGFQQLNRREPEIPLDIQQ